MLLPILDAGREKYLGLKVGEIPPIVELMITASDSPQLTSGYFGSPRQQWMVCKAEARKPAPANGWNLAFGSVFVTLSLIFPS